MYNMELKDHAGCMAGALGTETVSKNGIYLKRLKNRKKFLIPVMAVMSLLLLCNGCLSSKKMFAPYNKMMQAWIGKPEESIYTVYGPAARTQELSQEKKIVGYEYTTIMYGDGYRCGVLFTVENGIITDATYNGNYGAVSQYVRGPRN